MTTTDTTTDQNTGNSTDGGTGAEISRRDAIQTIGVVGTSLTAYVSRSKARSYSNIVVEKGEGWQVTKRVPSAWYDRTRTVDRLKEVLNEKYESDRNVAGTAITPGHNRIDGYRLPELKLFIHPDADLDRSYPDSLRGIPIQKERRRPPVPFSNGCYNNDTPNDYYYGGYLVNGPYGAGTTCCKVLKNSTIYMLTVNHIFKEDKGDCGEDTSGYSLYAGGKLVGHTTYNFSEEYDYHLIEEDGNVEFADYIKEPYGTYQRVASYFTYDGVKYLANKGKEVVQKVGIETGLAKGGKITDYNVDWDPSRTCFDWSDGIITTNCAARGDSGGPIFASTEYQDSDPPGDVSIIALFYGTTPDANVIGSSCNGIDIYSEAQGPAAWKLNSKFDIKFDI